MRFWISSVALLVLLACTLTACTPEKFDEPICRAPAKMSSEQDGTSFASGYFPADYAKPTENCGYPVGPVPIIGDIESEWYPSQWKAASEPSFYELARCEKLPDFALRFSYVPSFTPSVFIRIQSDGDGLKLIAKEMTGAGGYDPGVIARSKELRLTENQASELMRLLKSEGLFQEPPSICDQGFDGSKWIFELVDNQGYKMVKRWSPDKGPALKVGRFLFDLTGWRIKKY